MIGLDFPRLSRGGGGIGGRGYWGALSSDAFPPLDVGNQSSNPIMCSVRTMYGGGGGGGGSISTIHMQALSPPPPASCLPPSSPPPRRCLLSPFRHPKLVRASFKRHFPNVTQCWLIKHFGLLWGFGHIHDVARGNTSARNTPTTTLTPPPPRMGPPLDISRKW